MEDVSLTYLSPLPAHNQMLSVKKIQIPLWTFLTGLNSQLLDTCKWAILLAIKNNVPRGPLILKQMLFNSPLIRSVSGLIYWALLTPNLLNSIPSRLSREWIWATLLAGRLGEHKWFLKTFISCNLMKIYYMLACIWPRPERICFPARAQVTSVVNRARTIH